MNMYLSEVYGKGGIYAKCVTASIANGIPVYTLEIKAPKFINAEINTHRMLSKNFSSSRAIPFKELDEIYLPFDIRKKQKGMQGNKKADKLVTNTFRSFVNDLYHEVFHTINLLSHNIHKQHLNRYLEPWMFQKGIITATEWDNFFKLRLAPEAQPEIQELAKCMKEAIDQVEPEELRYGKWHLPYINVKDFLLKDNPKLIDLDKAIPCSVSRCARVSTLNHDGSNPSIEKDIALYEKLIDYYHCSPLEHQLTPMHDLYGVYEKDTNDFYVSDWELGITHMDANHRLWSGNMRGFIQNRQRLQEWN